MADPRRIGELRRHLIQFSEQAEWECLNLTGQDESRILEMILFPPGHCEPVFFLLDSQGRLHPAYEFDNDGEEQACWCSVKTQYGPLEAHIQIAELMRQIQREYMPDLEVTDEGGYWETESVERLRSAREFLAHKMAFFTEALDSYESEPSDMSPEEMCDALEEAARKSLEHAKLRLQ